MFPYEMTLPEFHMVAGESKNIMIPIYTSSGQQIDVTGMTAYCSICDYVNLNTTPYAVKDCKVIPGVSGSAAVFFISLVPSDTVNLYGKYIYQLTAKAESDSLGVMCGYLYITPNHDPFAIAM